MGAAINKSMNATEDLEKRREAATDAVIAKLNSLGLISCPVCKSHEWNIEVAGVVVTLYPIADVNFPLPPPQVPTALLTCTKCGFMSFHALQVLGVNL